MKKYIIIILFVAAIGAMIAYIISNQRNAISQTPVIDGVYLAEPQSIQNFKLQDHQGKLFTKENLKSHWTLMFFGFTNCGMVCPTTMAALNTFYKSMQTKTSKAFMPQVVMVSVDPDRDTQSKLNSYVQTFNSQFIGVRGDEKETIALEKQLHIAVAKLEVDGEGENHYTLNHTAEILVFNPVAKLQAFLSYPHEPKQMEKDYQWIVEHAK